MSRHGGAGGAYWGFLGSFFACIRKRPKNRVVAHPAHPRDPRRSAGVGSDRSTKGLVCAICHRPDQLPSMP